MPNECVLGLFEKFDGRARLHHFTIIHHNDLIGKCQGFGLVMGHIDHRTLDAVLQFLELGAQLPFQMRINHREGFIEHDDIHIRAHKTAPQRNFLFAVRR